MKQIQKDEIYSHLSEFLKGKGVQLKEGPYTKGKHAGCSMLTDAINLSQAGLERAKAGFERGMDQMRQAIHEKTAPKSLHRSSTVAGSKTAKGKQSRKKGAGATKRPGRFGK